ncbi:MAG: hypothetical protein GX962_02720 [Epulopiscium sp.]|nr:hypothetical protein [Candidatus Epulonipiscium sp.]
MKCKIYYPKNTCYLLTILFLATAFLLSTGCEKKKDPKSSDQKTEKPVSLNELMQLSEELITMTDQKRWNEASEKLKTMHTKWNQFYSQGQKLGITSDQASAFGQDLNQVTHLIINKSMEEMKKNIALEYEKAQIKLEMQKNMSSSSQKGQQQESGQSGTQGGGGGSMGGTQGNSSGGSNGGSASSQTEGGSSNSAQAITIELPEEVLRKYEAALHPSSNDLQISDSIIQLSKHIPHFLSLYEEGIASSVLRLKYYVRDIKISGLQNDWARSEEDLKKLKEIWSLVQSSIMKDKEEVMLQFAQSIVDIEEMIKEKDAQLLSLKSDIALDNIEKMTD